jgi:ribosome biogenesis GTPase
MNRFSEIKLEDLGYDYFFKTEAEKLGLDKYLITRVIAEYRGLYRVRGESGEYLAKITGKQMFRATIREDYPAVGDWLIVEKLPQRKAVIIDILPRKTLLKKKYSSRNENQVIAVNVDVIFITESMDVDFNLNRLERYLVLAEEADIRPVVILNKIDLISEKELENRIGKIRNRFDDVEIISSSSFDEKGIDELLKFIEKGKTYCFLGSSGVGKSSLINKLLVNEEIKTREISMSSGKGTHTTTTREMYLLKNGGIVIDNPGTREVGVSDSDVGMKNVFGEINTLSRKCKFSNCTHVMEPGCAVLKSIEDGELDEDKFENYMKMKKESDFYKMSDLEKKERDKRFGQYVKKVLASHRKR